MSSVKLSVRRSHACHVAHKLDEFGPQLYENFDRSRMLPSASVPQTGSRPTMFSRKSHTGDSVLSHPMLWLDERIFGEWQDETARN
jgi:glycerol-3-phosphate O-acyltransferase/dihydroxyacetone phosphate acyltransferase